MANQIGSSRKKVKIGKFKRCLQKRNRQRFQGA